LVKKIAAAIGYAAMGVALLGFLYYAVTISLIFYAFYKGGHPG